MRRDDIRYWATLVTAVCMPILILIVGTGISTLKAHGDDIAVLQSHSFTRTEAKAESDEFRKEISNIKLQAALNLPPEAPEWLVNQFQELREEIRALSSEVTRLGTKLEVHIKISEKE